MLNKIASLYRQPVYRFADGGFVTGGGGPMSDAERQRYIDIKAAEDKAAAEKLAAYTPSAPHLAKYFADPSLIPKKFGETEAEAINRLKAVDMERTEHVAGRDALRAQMGPNDVAIGGEIFRGGLGGGGGGGGGDVSDPFVAGTVSQSNPSAPSAVYQQPMPFTNSSGTIYPNSIQTPQGSQPTYFPTSWWTSSPTASNAYGRTTGSTARNFDAEMADYRAKYAPVYTLPKAPPVITPPSASTPVAPDPTKPPTEDPGSGMEWKWDGSKWVAQPVQPAAARGGEVNKLWNKYHGR